MVEVGNDAVISRLLEDSEDREAWEAAREPGSDAFDALMRRCLAVVQSDPQQSFPMLDTALRIVTSPCDVVQVFGLRASANRLLGSPVLAFAELECAFQIAANCQLCRAHLFRRRSAVYAAMGRPSEAFSDADEAIRLYGAFEGCGNDASHGSPGSGLAKAYHARADVRQFIGISQKDPVLIRGSVEDFSKALDLTDADVSPDLFCFCLSGLAYVLLFTGDPKDFERAYGYLCQARERMKVQHKPSQERAKLAWVTAMVCHAIMDWKRGMRPAKVLEMLRRALSDFVKIAMPQESAAVASDLARLVFPDQNAVRALVKDLSDRLESRFEMPDVAHRIGELAAISQAITRVRAACDLEDDWDAPFRLREAIQGLRDAAGPGMITCLVQWKEI